MMPWRRLQSTFCFPSFSSFPDLTYTQKLKNLWGQLFLHLMLCLRRIKEPEINELTVGATILLIRWRDGSCRVLEERVQLVSYVTTWHKISTTLLSVAVVWNLRNSPAQANIAVWFRQIWYALHQSIKFINARGVNLLCCIWILRIPWGYILN